MGTRWHSDLHDVVLTGIPAGGEAVMAIARLLRDTLGVGNREARHFLENLPQAVKEDLPEKDAQALRDTFRKAGAVAELRPSGGIRGRVRR